MYRGPQRKELFFGTAESKGRGSVRKGEWAHAWWRGGEEACDLLKKKTEKKASQSQNVKTCKEIQKQQAALSSRGTVELSPSPENSLTPHQ